MADTQRSIATLLASHFQTGQFKGMGSDDMRDLIVSIGLPPFGSCSVDGNATATVISTSSVYVKVAGTMVSGDSSADMSGAGNKLTYTGAAIRHFHIVTNMSVTTAGNNVVVNIKLGKNGTVIGTPVRRKVGTGSDVGAMSVHADVMLDTNDYIEVFVANDTDTSNITVEDLYFFAVGMPV